MPPRPDAGGTCDLVPPTTGMPPRCCYADADCPDGPGGVARHCYGGSCTAGGLGICVPRPMPGQCYGDLDCPSGQTCHDGSLGCDSCTAGCAMAMIGSCG